jgi:hypothetical protein
VSLRGRACSYVTVCIIITVSPGKDANSETGIRQDEENVNEPHLEHEVGRNFTINAGFY